MTTDIQDKIRMSNLCTEIVIDEKDRWPQHNSIYNVFIAVEHIGPRYIDEPDVRVCQCHPDIDALLWKNAEPFVEYFAKGDLPIASGFYWLRVMFKEQRDPEEPSNYICRFKVMSLKREWDLIPSEVSDFKILRNRHPKP